MGAQGSVGLLAGRRDGGVEDGGVGGSGGEAAATLLGAAWGRWAGVVAGAEAVADAADAVCSDAEAEVWEEAAALCVDVEAEAAELVTCWVSLPQV